MGAGRFPVAVTTETTIWAVLHCCLCCGDGYSVVFGLVPAHHTLCCVVVRVVGGWVGCGPYSGRSRLLLVLTPHHTLLACVGVGVLLFVLAY